jgi:hypothetical protein
LGGLTVDLFNTMMDGFASGRNAKVIFGMTMSLDGFITSDAEGVTRYDNRSN